jgi:hypothetical protein
MNRIITVSEWHICTSDFLNANKPMILRLEVMMMKQRMPYIDLGIYEWSLVCLPSLSSFRFICCASICCRFRSRLNQHFQTSCRFLKARLIINHCSTFHFCNIIHCVKFTLVNIIESLNTHRVIEYSSSHWILIESLNTHRVTQYSSSHWILIESWNNHRVSKQPSSHSIFIESLNTHRIFKHSSSH